MTIRFLVNNVYSGWMPDDTRLGGTEESVVEWAAILSVKYKVQVFSNFMSEEPFEYRGVTYSPRGGYLYQVGLEPGITINVKSHDIPVVEPSVYLTNEVDAYRYDLSDFYCCILPSQWAVDNIPVNTETKIVPHGFDKTEIYPAKKIPKQVLYASSPDRGLQALELIWPAVVVEHPDAQLIVTYGGELNTPNTTCLGTVNEKKMNQLYRESDVWVHPCSGGELYCISGIKAQAAGAIPVYFPVMALQETVKHGIQCFDERDMYRNLIDLLGNEREKKVIRKHLAKTHYPSWVDSTLALEDAISGIL